MSDGMTDSRAEGAIYYRVKRAVWDVREAIGRGRLDHSLVSGVNELIADLGWAFELMQYARPEHDGMPVTQERAEKVWNAVAELRRALKSHNVGHRGWRLDIDPEVDWALAGSGYGLFEKVRMS